MIRASQEPPKNFKIIFGFDEFHPTFGNQPVIGVKNFDAREVLDFAVEPMCSMAFNTAFRPVKQDVGSLKLPLPMQILI